MRRQGSTLTAVLCLGVVAVLAPLGAAAWDSKPKSFREELRPLLNLSDSAERSEDPDMATCEDDVYVVFRDAATGNGDIYLRKSKDRGESFGKARLLGGGDGVAFGPRIAVQGERVYVAWDENGGAGVFLRESDDGARSFGPILTIDPDPQADNPRIAASGCDVYVAWNVEVAEDTVELRFRASHDCGRSFGPIRTIGQQMGLTQLIATNKNVYVLGITAADDAPGVLFTRSTDEGRTFSPVQNLSPEDSINAPRPRMAVQGNNVYVVWEECPPGLPFCDVEFRRSKNRGASFGPREILSDSEGFALAPDVAAEGDHVYVVWQDSASGVFDIFLRKSDDQGRNFDRAENLSRTTGESLEPSISAEKQFVRVVWEDTTPGVTDIFYRASGDFAEHFGPVKNLSRTPGTSGGPGGFGPLVLSSKDGKNGYVVWVDDLEDNLEVLFRSTEVEH